MALCFVANKDLTAPLSKIAQSLRARGEDVLWISPSNRWTKWLVRDGWARSDILNIPDFSSEWRNLSIEEAAARLSDVEREAPQTISNVIQMCRSLCRRPATFAYPYLAVIREHVEPLLRERGVEVIFGEGTWGFELIIWLLCQRMGIPMVTPATTRIPSGRFYFADAQSSDLCSFTRARTGDLAWAENFLTAWRDRPIQPDYMLAHAQGYKPLRLRWLKELATALFRPSLDRDDGTLWPLQARIVDRIIRIVNSKSFWLQPFERELKEERYVLYTLHHQPEAAVDVFGSLNSNQEAVIESLSRLLPSTHKLWVKEHKGAIGDRSIAWYRRIRRLPNVRLIDPFRGIYPLIRNADLVVTVSGTAGYEAALMGVPTVGLAPVFFASLMGNRPTARSHPLEWRMNELLASKQQLQSAEGTRRSIEFLAHLYANSFAGNPCDLEAPEARRQAAGYLADESDGFLAFVRGLRGQAKLAPASGRPG